MEKLREEERWERKKPHKEEVERREGMEKGTEKSG